MVEYLSREGKQSKRGWLVRTDRRLRRDNPDTLTDTHVLKLINHILNGKNYCAPNVPKPAERLIRLRDAAAVAMCWIFFKRGGENIRLKLSDVSFDARRMRVKFHIEKKRKRYRICENNHAQVKNARNSKYCKECGVDISQIPSTEIGEKETAIKTKTKSMKYAFVEYVTNWLEALKSDKIPGVTSDSWLFPKYSYVGDKWYPNSEKHLTIQRLNQILQAIDPTLTSHMFRYGHTEVLLRNGYTPYECSVVGDWSSDKLPQDYAKKKGITLEEQRFSEDLSV